MILNVLLFILENIGLIIMILFLIIILYNWIAMFLNKDYKLIANYNEKYKNRVLTNKDLENLKFKIKNMEGREFEVFCEYLFNKIGKYKLVKLTPAINDEGKDLILIDNEDNKIFVECKRYSDKDTVTGNFMIGREICQKLVGAIVADGIGKGIIVTTGNIHQNAWNYINKLESNSNIKIEFITLQDIMRMVQEINSSEVLNVFEVDV